MARRIYEVVWLVGVTLYTLAAIRTALEAAGVVFTNGEEPGVDLRKVAN